MKTINNTIVKRIIVTAVMAFLFVMNTAFLLNARVSADENDRAESRADSLKLAKKYFSFAVQFKDIGNVEEAIKNYRRSIAFNDSVYQVHYSFADYLLKNGKTEEARAEFAKTLALNPSHYNTAARLAQLYSKESVYDSTLMMYEIMYSIKPEKTELLESIVSLNEYLKRDEAALNNYTTMLEKDAVDKEKMLKAGQLALKLKKWDTAIRFGEALSDNDNGNGEADKLIFYALINSGKYETALDRMKTLAGTREIDSGIVSNLDQKISDLENPNLTQGMLELKVKLKSTDSSVYSELAEIYLKNNKLNEANSTVEQGLSINPEDGKLHIIMGNIHESNGNEDKAVESYEKALADADWEDSAKQFIWRLRPPETDEEKAEQEFFKRGRHRERQRGAE